jgi:ABC-type antimicrobial peptide transport system permease subunit
MVIRQALELVAAGVSIGLVAALALTRVLTGMLFGIKSTDPLTFACVVAILVGVSLLASYIPARRATKIHPMVALRHE